MSGSTAKPRKARDAEFNAAAQAMLRRLGTVDNARECYPLRLQTRVGALLLAVADGWLATRFDDVDRACEVLNPRREWDNRFNPHSGKWNFDLSYDCTVPAAVDYIEAAIAPLLQEDGRTARAASA